MYFNSIDFAVFLPIVFVLYWFISAQRISVQNVILLVASYVFYAWWDWRFLSLILFSTLVDYFVARGLGICNANRTRKVLLWTSIGVNLGFLGFFKYYNFFVDNFVSAFSLFGAEIQGQTLRIILPVGISFYTFQTLSYSIDVYKRKIEPTKDFIAFAAYVSFFPQLVAGPIERAANLLPQFRNARVFEYAKAVDGLKQILWGLFKKIVIADNCAEYANMIFNNSADYSGSVLLIGAVLFAFQIYGDFSGYSDIAIGTARLFGFSLMQNFAFPYFSRDIAEFWRRWHISLSTWFRDYLYIPLGGSRGSVYKTLRNTVIIFIVSGFWHGANWTFITWGALHALFFIPLVLLQKNKRYVTIVAAQKGLPSLYEFFQMLGTFFLVVFAWIFFRAISVSHAFEYISTMVSSSFFTLPVIAKPSASSISMLTLSVLMCVFICVEWCGRTYRYGFAPIAVAWRRPFRFALYFIVMCAIFWFGGAEQEFIYFQF